MSRTHRWLHAVAAAGRMTTCRGLRCRSSSVQSDTAADQRGSIHTTHHLFKCIHVHIAYKKNTM